MTAKNSNLNSAARDQLATYIVSGEGAKLASEAQRMLDEGVAPHNALVALSAVATAKLPQDLARHAAGVVWTQATLRGRAVEKLGWEIGGAVLFDSGGLQMASGIVAAQHHAQIARVAGARRVIDLTAGIGIDSIAFALAGLEVIAYEVDELRAVLLKENVVRLGLGNKIHARAGDSMAEGAYTADEADGACIYLDPPRRDEASRWGNADLAERHLERALSQNPPAVLMKLSPAADRALGARHAADLEFVSVEGECREMLLRWGAARVDAARLPQISAVLLPSGAALTAEAAAEDHVARHGSIGDAQFLYEPDPAVIRAGLAGQLASAHGLMGFDSEVAYLVSDSLIETPFATAYRIVDSFPYHPRKVQAWLTTRGATQLIVKKRGVPDEPEAVRDSFKLAKASGAPVPAILALTRQGRQRWALFLERV